MPAYDEAHRRKAIRRGAESGVWVFIPAAELELAGVETAGRPPLWYRVWARPRGSVLVRLYREG